MATMDAVRSTTDVANRFHELQARDNGARYKMNYFLMTQ
jgi:hypothetical protein